jgi:hypothetical protein
LLVLVVASASLGGFVLLREDRSDGWVEFPSPDPWYRCPTDDFIQSAEARERDPATFAVVTRNEAEALARLEHVPCIEVSEREAEELAGRVLGGTDGRFVLLRALCYDTPNGGFAVRWRPGAVLVSHGCLGTRPLPVVRRAVVVRLPDVPAEVFVSLDMAE